MSSGYDRLREERNGHIPDFNSSSKNGNRSLNRKIAEVLNSRAGCTLLSKIIFSIALTICTAAVTASVIFLNPQWIPSLPEFASNQYSNLFGSGYPSTRIYVVTPTAKKRNAQKADLTRLSQTLRLVPNLHWVVVEDSTVEHPMIKGILKRSGLNFTHLHTPTDPKLTKGRGMTQRNLGVRWIKEQHANESLDKIDAVVYFGDDDNSYDVRLFNEYIRKIKTVGVWAIAFPSNSEVEMPNVDNGTVVSWNTSWAPKRDFAIDMAGFAINLRMFMIYNAEFNERCKTSYFEPCLLNQFNITKKDLEVYGFDKPEGEREILVWHTKTKQNEMKLKGGNKGFQVG